MTDRRNMIGNIDKGENSILGKIKWHFLLKPPMNLPVVKIVFFFIFSWCRYVGHFSVVDYCLPCSTFNMLFSIIFTILAWIHPWSNVNKQQWVVYSIWTVTILPPRAVCDLARDKCMERLEILLILWKDFCWNPLCVLESSGQYLCTCSGFAVGCYTTGTHFVLSEISLWKINLCYCWGYAKYCR